MEYKLKVVFKNGSEETGTYPTKDKARKMAKGFEKIFGKQIDRWHIFGVESKGYSKNPLDDMNFDEDDEDYFFDIPSDAF